ncbi:RmlC-like cupin domain-containing protein [Phellopilus nigrolimitatus]|nr:RmlC-like cupin domain-containing protein [Phellopilus nigrolimitatus]
MENYPSGNDEIKKSLNLLKHPEGGYFAETDRQKATVPSPFAGNEPRDLATSIFYFLSYDNPTGVIHINKSVTYHVLHQGRAEYTLITPGADGKPPTIETKIMGTDAANGELRMLFVGTGVWKMSRLLPEDLALGTTPKEQNKVGCLITEVVVPGFHWEDHQFLTRANLEALFDGVDKKEEKIKLLAPYVKKGE